MAEKEEKGFLNRWSARKQARRLDEPLPPEPGEESPARAPELSEEEAAARQKEIDDYVASLPEPESLSYDSDFTAFFKEGVPEVLKRRAMRVLWRSNPVLANLDGLIDYGEDFTDKATVVPNLKTLYRVGKGMFTDEDLIKEERRRAGLPPEEPLEAQETAQSGKTTDESPEETAEFPTEAGSDPAVSEAATADSGLVDEAEAQPSETPAPERVGEPGDKAASPRPHARSANLPVGKKRPALARRWGPPGDPSS
ncbi:MAG: DUF3306 domain-containing protein [Limibacillus sp.]